METTLETSLSLPVLAIGAIASIVLFLALLRTESPSLTPLTRWSLILLRGLLCLLVWVLIAQPRAVTTRRESIPVTTKLGVDVSDSMSLIDGAGVQTRRWLDDAKPTPLDEAIALAEVAKIRLHLLRRDFQVDDQDLDSEVAQIGELLMQARERIETLESSTSAARLLQTPLEAVDETLGQLQRVEEQDAIRAVERAALFAAELAQDLRRIEVVVEQDAQPTSEPRDRMELVNRWMQKSAALFAELAQAGDLQRFVFANAMIEAPAETLKTGSLGTGTDLYANLSRLADDDGREGARLCLLVTDGVDSNPAPEAGISPRAQDQPLLVLPVGDPSDAPDVSIQSVISPARLQQGDEFLARVELANQNTAAETVSLSLLDRGRELVRRDVQLEFQDASQIVELKWDATVVGAHDLVVEVSQAAGEEILENNRRQLQCQVMKDKYRVLVCDSKPRWETRYLQNLFKRDPSIEMTSLLFEPRHAYPGKASPPALALPLALELWQKFDLVILGDLNTRQLTAEHQQVVVRYVDAGGNLLILAGFDSMPDAFAGTPIEKLLPMMPTQANPILGQFRIGPLTDENVDPMVRLENESRQPMWRRLFEMTPQYRISSWCRAKETARPLLIAEDQASEVTYDFMALQRYGNGRVAFAAAPCLYHLRSTYGDRYHARFWGQMIRGICVDDYGFEGGLVKTRLDRTLWSPGAEVQGRVRLTTDDGLPLPEAEFSALLLVNDEIVARMNPIADTDRPGDYFVRFPELAAGEYTIEYEGEEVDSLLEADRTIEVDETARKFTVLGRRLSPETTRSTKPSPFFDHVNRMPLAATISPQTLPLAIQALNLEPQTITRTSKRALWDVWWLLLLIVTVASGEWLLRRMNGLC